MSLTSIVMAWMFWSAVISAVYGFVALIWGENLIRRNSKWKRWLDGRKYLMAIGINLVICMTVLFVTDAIQCHAGGGVYHIFGRYGIPGCVG